MAEASRSELARHRDLGGRRPQSRRRRSSWSALTHLPKHLQTAIVSYRRQADQSGDLDPGIRQFLDRIVEKEAPESVTAKLVAFDRGQVELKAGTILSREWTIGRSLLAMASCGTGHGTTASRPSPSPSPAPAGTAPASLACGIAQSVGRTGREGGKSGVPRDRPVRDLYPGLDRQWPRPGVQLAGCPV
jgi:hypothetical protein